MEETKEMIDLIENNGYIKKFYVYCKITKNYTHWINIYSESIQLYCYLTEDKEMDRCYDSGMININLELLEKLINMWQFNYE